MKHVLLTGGFGYVGSELLTLLTSRKDITVTVLDNGLSGPALDNIAFIHGDIRDELLVRNILPQYHTIVHLAGIVGAPACAINEDYAYDVNVNGTKNLLKNLMPWQKFVFASSSSVYGDRSGEKVYEGSHIAPVNSYSVHKALGEHLTTLSAPEYIILRPVTAFGTSARTRLDVLINTLIFEALTEAKVVCYEPDIIRPMLHVRDYARILEHAIDGDLGRNEIYNIGDPSLTVLKKQLVDMIASICDVPIHNIRKNSLDPRNYDVSFDKLVNTSFQFTPNPIHVAIEQLKLQLPELIKNPAFYNRPESVRNFLKEKGIVY